MGISYIKILLTFLNKTLYKKYAFISLELLFRSRIAETLGRYMLNLIRNCKINLHFTLYARQNNDSSKIPMSSSPEFVSMLPYRTTGILQM